MAVIAHCAALLLRHRGRWLMRWAVARARRWAATSEVGGGVRVSRGLKVL